LTIDTCELGKLVILVIVQSLLPVTIFHAVAVLVFI